MVNSLQSNKFAGLPKNGKAISENSYKSVMRKLPMRKVIVSQKIKEFRIREGLTQAQIAELFDVSAQAISKWEREECYPDITLLPILADTIGCKVDDFFA